jgi:hypothetical protein
MKRHTLSGLGTDSGQRTQRIDEPSERGSVLHLEALTQNGILKPGGRRSPDIKDDMRCWLSVSTRRTASLMAAATRSSSISLHAFHFVLAGHRDLDHAAAGLADDFHLRDLFLRLLHVALQSFRLLHHIAEIGHR